MAEPISALIVGDASLFRKTLSMAVEAAGGKAIGIAANGEIALARLAEIRVDVVFVDVSMPGMSGLELLVRVRGDHPEVAVVMVGGMAERDAEVMVAALVVGAIDFIAKPSAETLTANVETIAGEVARVLKVVAAGRPASTAAAPPLSSPSTISSPPSPRFLLVGAFTGGPEALARFLPALPGDFPAPIAVAQHMPVGFTRPLAAAEALPAAMRSPRC